MRRRNRVPLDDRAVVRLRKCCARRADRIWCCVAAEHGREESWWFQGFWPTGGLAVPFVEMGIIEGAIVWDVGWKRSLLF